ncbi:MAG: hypothetical protein ABIV63_02645 [Caldimonas sp.]
MSVRSTVRPFDVGTDFHIADTTQDAVLVAVERSSRRRVVGVGIVFLWFFIGGIAHFVATEAEMRIVPPYIPWPRAAVLISGAFELLGAVGLLRLQTRRAAGIGLFLLTIAVTPAHLYMLQAPELFPSVPIWVLWLRLPIQIALLVLIAWCTAPSRTPRRLFARTSA